MIDLMFQQLEEADWFGLPVGEALRKYKMLNAKESVKPPLKYELTLKLLDQLEGMNCGI